jgi:hypothetical protein
VLESARAADCDAERGQTHVELDFCIAVMQSNLANNFLDLGEEILA